MEEFNPKYNPADKIPLHSDLEGEEYCETRNYQSIVGMLLYLGGSTKPDMTYTVHQCARFSHALKRSHKIGIKHIIRYLRGTREKGLVMKPHLSDLHLDLFANAYFAGLYASEDKWNPVSVKSRTDIMLNFGDVLVVWSSKLQAEISLCTLESEYTALSQGMREFVAAKGLLKESNQRIKFNLNIEPNVAYAWEYNTWTQNLANRKGPLWLHEQKMLASNTLVSLQDLTKGHSCQKDWHQETAMGSIYKRFDKVEFEQKRKLIIGW